MLSTLTHRKMMTELIHALNAEQATVPAAFSRNPGDQEQRRWADRISADHRVFPWRGDLGASRGTASADVRRFFEQVGRRLQGCRQCGASNTNQAVKCYVCNAELEEVAVAESRLPASARISLLAINEDGSDGTLHNLEYEESIIGRGGDIRFPDDQFLTPRHAVLRIRRGGLVVEDLDSLNGTFVKLTTPVRLSDGDMFLMGRQVLRFSRNSVSGSAGRRVRDLEGTRYMGSPSPTGEYRVEQIGVGGFVLAAYTVPAEGVTIGRERGDITFGGDKFMSSQHARIAPLKNGKGLAIEDMKSSNGTWLRIHRPSRLNDGDFLFLGQQLFRVSYGR